LTRKEEREALVRGITASVVHAIGSHLDDDTSDSPDTLKNSLRAAACTIVEASIHDALAAREGSVLQSAHERSDSAAETRNALRYSLDSGVGSSDAEGGSSAGPSRSSFNTAGNTSLTPTIEAHPNSNHFPPEEIDPRLGQSITGYTTGDMTGDSLSSSSQKGATTQPDNEVTGEMVDSDFDRQQGDTFTLLFEDTLQAAQHNMTDSSNELEAFMEDSDDIDGRVESDVDEFVD
jgi:hypothetical protein